MQRLSSQAGWIPRVLALGIAQNIAWASSTYLPAIVAAPIAADLGVSRPVVFAGYSLALLAMAAAGPAVGRAVDAGGGRRVLVASNLVLAAGLSLLAASTGLAPMFVAWATIGVGMALGLYDAAFAALVRLRGPAARREMTALTLLGGFGSTVGWTVGALLVDASGWRATCLFWAATHLLIALPLNRRWLADGRSDAVHADAKADAAANLSPRAGDSHRPLEDASKPAPPTQPRAFAMLVLFSACTAFVTSAMAAHLPGVLAATGTAATAVFAAALVGPAQVAARFAESALVHFAAVHPLATARLATALHPIGAAALLAFGGLPAAAAVFALMHGAGNGLLTIAKGTLPLAIFGAAGYGALQGALSVIPRIAQAAAPLVFGLMLDSAGAAVAIVCTAVLSLAALASLRGFAR